MRAETKTIIELVARIDEKLTQAVRTNTDAYAAFRNGRVNEGIGTILMLEQDLELALQVYRAVLAIHRNPPTKGASL